MRGWRGAPGTALHSPGRSKWTTTNAPHPFYHDLAPAPPPPPPAAQGPLFAPNKQDLGVTSDVTIMSALFNNFDADGDGHISYTEFVKGFRVDDEKELPRLGIKLRAEFARHPDAVFFHRVFGELDVDASGLITSDEFLMTMDTLGIRNLDHADAIAIFQQVDPQPSPRPPPPPLHARA